MGESLPFWVDLKLEPASIAYALLLALVAAAMIGLLPALKAAGASVQRGLQGIMSAGGTIKFGGIWSFIIGAQVACTLLFVPAAWESSPTPSTTSRGGQRFRRSVTSPSVSASTTKRGPASRACLMISRSPRVGGWHTKSSRFACVGSPA
jgi:Flp pilus assembly pilin Flp